MWQLGPDSLRDIKMPEKLLLQGAYQGAVVLAHDKRGLSGTSPECARGRKL